MKNNILIAFILFAFVACQNQATPKKEHREPKKEEVKVSTPTTDTLHVHVYACPMHPEVTGKEGDKCPKCGMALTHKE